MDFQDINKNLINGENMGGIAQTIYFGLHADVLTWPTKPTQAVEDLEALGALTGDIAMKPGKRMFEMYITDDTGELQMETVGEKDGKSFVNAPPIVPPRIIAKNPWFPQCTKNENMVFIVPVQ